MRVIFTQIGGFAPAFKGCELDTATLSAAEAVRLQALIEDSGIFNSEGRKTSGARDVHLYALTVERSQGSHEVTFDDLSIPASAKPLLAFLLDHSHELLP
jgi:hypothetical protein